MLAATLVAIFIIPVTFYVAERFRRKPQEAPGPEAVPVPISGGVDGHASIERNPR